jgi:cyclase
VNYRRIIPCLDVKDGRLVKGVHFVDLKDIGDPAENAAAYSAAGADELVFLDITATTEKRKILLATVAKTVAAATVPLTVGGGIATLEDIRELLALGVARVAINTAAVLNPELIRQAAAEFGREKIVVAIDTRYSAAMPSDFEVMIRGGREAAGIDAVAWAKKAEELGAGTLLPTSMDRDGSQEGYDLPLLRAITQAVKIPVIASGGAGKLEHLYEAIASGGADGVLVASIAHFGKYTIRQMKEYLAERGVPVRL